MRDKGNIQGCLTYLLQNERQQVQDVHSVSAGLDYAATGPQHAFLHERNLAEYTAVSDESALRAFWELTRLEGIIPALESSHALGYVLDNAESLRGKTVLVNLSGRGDKDLGIIESHMEGR